MYLVSVYSTNRTLRKNLYTVDISSPTYLFRLVNVGVETRPVFSGWTRFWTQHSGWVRLGWPSGSKKGSKRVGLASNRVQIRIQPYNVLNKLDLNPTRFWVRPSGSKIRLSRVGLALRVKIWVKFGSGWSGSLPALTQRTYRGFFWGHMNIFFFVVSWIEWTWKRTKRDFIYSSN